MCFVAEKQGPQKGKWRGVGGKKREQRVAFGSSLPLHLQASAVTRSRSAVIKLHVFYVTKTEATHRKKKERNGKEKIASWAPGFTRFMRFRQCIVKTPLQGTLCAQSEESSCGIRGIDNGKSEKRRSKVEKDGRLTTAVCRPSDPTPRLVD